MKLQAAQHGGACTGTQQAEEVRNTPLDTKNKAVKLHMTSPFLLLQVTQQAHARSHTRNSTALGCHTAQNA